MNDETEKTPSSHLRLVEPEKHQSEAEKNFPGVRLVNLLKRRAEKNNEVMSGIAEHLGVSLSYLSSIFRGLRPVTGMSREAYVNAANYLNLPVAQIYLLADVMKLSDFYPEQSVSAVCERIHDSMCLDPKWSGYVPSASTWTSMPMSVKILIGLLYEASGGPRFSELKSASDKEG